MIAVLFLLGLSFGSFLLVVVDRLRTHESFVKGRSHCDFCKHTLAWYDLIPVVSFCLTGGTCRYCKRRLSFAYPLTELLCGLLFIVTFVLLPPVNASVMSALLILLLLVNMSLFVIFFSDLFHGTIPFAVVAVATIAALVYILLTNIAAVPEHVISGCIAFLFFLLLFFVTRGRGIGFGDVVYGFFMGFFLGFPGIIVGLYLAFLTGAAVSLILVLAGKKKLTGSTISFGPFLVVGTFIAFYFGNELYRLMLAALHL